MSTALMTSCQTTPFEQAQARAKAGNPQWLSIELDTADGRHKFKESELIAFKIEYSSAVRELYKAETAEGWSPGAASDVLHISDGHTYPFDSSFVCCESRIIGLDDEPYIHRPTSGLHLKPGIYEMYLTTRRVYSWDITPKVYSPSEWETASNLLKIRIIPDPGWQERVFARFKANPKEGCSAIFLLDIPKATAEKLESIRYTTPCTSQLSSSVFNESEYPAALKGMDQIINAPDYGVIQRDVNLILDMRGRLESTQFRKVPADKGQDEDLQESERQAFLQSERALVRELCDALPAKLPEAKRITQATIDRLTDNRRAPIANCK